MPKTRKKHQKLFDEHFKKSHNVTQKNKDNCSTCCNPLLESELGFLTCNNEKCSQICSELLDHGPEWKYCIQGNTTRCGMPTNDLLRESSFGCKVLWGGDKETRKVRRYTEWQSMPYKEKANYDEFQRIKRMADISGIPKIIVDSALRYHKMISNEKTVRGLNRDGIIAASLYIACKTCDFSRTPKEIADIFYFGNLIIFNATRSKMFISFSYFTIC